MRAYDDPSLFDTTRTFFLAERVRCIQFCELGKYVTKTKDFWNNFFFLFCTCYTHHMIYVCKSNKTIKLYIYSSRISLGYKKVSLSCSKRRLNDKYTMATDAKSK